MIREWETKDLKEIFEIELKCHLAPWTQDAFEKCFEVYKGWVIEENNQIIGFLVASLQSDEFHILNICIRPEYQRQGKGQMLLKHALLSAKKMKAGIAYLEVRRSNEHAIHLYQKMGFSEIGFRKDYYPLLSGREDALILALDLMNML